MLNRDLKLLWGLGGFWGVGVVLGGVFLFACLFGSWGVFGGFFIFCLV